MLVFELLILDFGTFEPLYGWFADPLGRGQDTNFFVVSLYGQLFPHGNFNVRFDCNFQWLSNVFDGSCDFHDANNVDHHCMIKSQHVLNIFSALRILSWFLLWNHWCHF